VAILLARQTIGSFQIREHRAVIRRGTRLPILAAPASY
jgi:hypothetical protein